MRAVSGRLYPFNRNTCVQIRLTYNSRPLKIRQQYSAGIRSPFTENVCCAVDIRVYKYAVLGLVQSSVDTASGKRVVSDGISVNRDAVAV